MTPLEIQLLLNLYTTPAPYTRYTTREICSDSMANAFLKFRDSGLLQDDVSWERNMIEQEGRDQFLSAKGMLLVERLMEVQP